MNLGHLPLGLPTDSSSYRTRVAPHRTQARCASKATVLAWLALEASHECISLRLDQPSNTPLLESTLLKPITKPYRKEVYSLIESNLVTARRRYLPNRVQVSQKRHFINFLRFVYTSATIPPKATPSRNGDHAKPEDAIALGFVSATKKSLCNLL